MDRQYMVLAAMAFELVGVIWVMSLIGRYFDEQQHWPGYALAVGALIGFSAWIFHLIVVLRTLAKDEENRDTKPK